MTAGRNATRQPLPTRAAPVRRAARATAGAPRGGVAIWWMEHRLAARETLLRMAETPFTTLFIWLVLAIALSLPAGFYLFLENVDRAAGGLDDAAQITLFLRLDLDDRAGLALAEKLEDHPGLSGVTYVTRQQALEEFRQASGLDSVLEELGGNPLPALIIARPVRALPGAEEARALRDELAAEPGVELAQLDLEWLARLRELLDLAERLGKGLALLLACAVLLVIGNITRMVIEERRQEIRVLQLVGGTRAYVSRPLLYTGCWHGLAGALLAWLLIALALAWLQPPVNELATLYDSEYKLTGLGAVEVVCLLASSAGLGWLGAWIAIRRHLERLEIA